MRRLVFLSGRPTSARRRHLFPRLPVPVDAEADTGTCSGAAVSATATGLRFRTVLHTLPAGARSAVIRDEKHLRNGRTKTTDFRHGTPSDPASHTHPAQKARQGIASEGVRNSAAGRAFFVSEVGNVGGKKTTDNGKLPAAGFRRQSRDKMPAHGSDRTPAVRKTAERRPKTGDGNGKYLAGQTTIP